MTLGIFFKNVCTYIAYVVVNKNTYSVFSFTHLEHLELLPAGAQCHLPVDFIINAFHISERTSILPIRPQGRNKFSPIDHTVSMVKLISYGVHLQPGGREPVLEDAVNEVVARQEAISVLVEFTEEIRHPGLFVIVMLEETFSPIIPIKVFDFF